MEKFISVEYFPYLNINTVMFFIATESFIILLSINFSFE